MKKYSWLFAILGVAALGMALMFAAAFGAGVTYFFLQADSVQAAFLAPIDVENGEGVLISGVKPESAAAEAGLVRGDIIFEIEGDPVNSTLEMKTIFAELDPGTEVELTVLHGDEIRKVEVVLDDVKGLAFLGVGTCDISKGENMFPGGPMGDVFIKGFPLGAEIVEVVPGSPAEDAGLQVGELILSVNEKPISPKVDLADLIQKFEPGDVVVLEIFSGTDEKPRSIEVTLGEHPDKLGQAFLGVAYQMGAPMGFEGGDFPFGELPEGFEDQEGMPHFFFHHGEGFEGELPEGWEEDGEFYFHDIPGMPFEGEGMPHFFDLDELPEGIEGAVIISEVLKDTPADEAGLQPGDLIIAIDGKPTAEIETFVDILQSHKPGDEVSLTIIREGAESEIRVTLTEHPDDPDMGFLGVLAGTFIMMDELQLPEGFDQNFEFEIPDVPGGDA